MKKQNPKDNEVQLPFEDDEFKSEWQVWLQYRSERRLPAYKPTGLKRTFSLLKNLSGDNPKTAVAIINQSIANNWQGLFMLRTNNLTNGTAYKRTVEEKPTPSGSVAAGGFGKL
jgi:hypothetical protein